MQCCKRNCHKHDQKQQWGWSHLSPEQFCVDSHLYGVGTFQRILHFHKLSYCRHVPVFWSKHYWSTLRAIVYIITTFSQATTDRLLDTRYLPAFCSNIFNVSNSHLLTKIKCLSWPETEEQSDNNVQENPNYQVPNKSISKTAQNYI